MASLRLNINYRLYDQCQKILEVNGLHTTVMGKTERILGGLNDRPIKDRELLGQNRPL